MSTKPARAISEQEISDAYIYLLGRLLVTRQQQLDFQEGLSGTSFSTGTHRRRRSDSNSRMKRIASKERGKWQKRNQTF